MICAGGEDVRPDNEGVPSIATMGKQLGRLVRFAGSTRDMWTVLTHSLVVASIMPEKYAIHGLMHDVPEMCTGDVPTPWKTKAAEAREAALLDRIYRHYGIPSVTKEAHLAVKKADVMALHAEAHVLGHPEPTAFSKDYDKETADLVLGMVENVLQFMMMPELAGEIFEEAFRQCQDLAAQ